MKAIILAAGKGTRLLPLTLETPKPLIQIGGKPIIDRIFNSLPEEIDEVVIVVEYLKERLKDRVGENFYGRKVSFVDQIEKKGTFGALLSARDLFKNDERFLVLNGDDMHEKQELEKYLHYPRSFGVQRMIMPNYYSIKLDRENYIEGFLPQNEEEKILGALVATGAYVIDANIFKHEGVSVYGGEYGLPQTILAQREDFPIKGIVTEKWVPINSFEDIEKAEKILNN